MSILSRYLLRLHVAPFVFALSALTSLLLLNQIARRFGDLVGKGLPWTVIAEVFILSVPFLIAMTLPMATLMAVLYAVSRLSSDNEITALRAGGISLGRIMRTLLWAGAGLAVVSFLFSDHVLPRSNHRLRALLTDINRTKPTFSLQEQVINVVKRNRLFLRAGRIDQATFTLHDVSIFDLANQQRQRVIYADSGHMGFTEDQSILMLNLFDGSMHEFNASDPQAFQVMDFRRNLVRVDGVGNTFARTLDDNYKGDREMSVCEMDVVIRGARQQIVKSERQAQAIELNSLRGLVGLQPVPVDTNAPELRPNLYCRALEGFTKWLSPDDLQAQGPVAGASQDATTGQRGQTPEPRVRNRIAPVRIAAARATRDRARNARIRAANYLVEAHKKYAIAAACIVFVLIGVPAALKFGRAGLGFVIGVSLVAFTVYYVGLIAGESLANRLIIPPFWAMWTSNIVFAVLGLIGLWRVQTVATALRSGWMRGKTRRYLEERPDQP